MDKPKNTFRPMVEAHGRLTEDGNERSDMDTLEMAVDHGADVAAILHTSLGGMLEDVLDGKTSDTQARALYGIRDELSNLSDYLNDIVASMHEMEA